MSKSRWTFAMILAGLLATNQAGAVVIDLDIKTEGEPVPQAEITFETLDGEPIDLALLEEEEDTESTEDPASPEASPLDEAKEGTPDTQAQPEEKPKETMTSSAEPTDNKVGEQPQLVKTDEAGNAQIAIADEFLGQELVAIIKRDGKVIKRHALTPDDTGSKEQIEAYDPADALISAGIAQIDDKCRRGADCAFELSFENRGNGIYEGPLFLQGSLRGDWISATSQLENMACSASRKGKTFCHADVSLQPGETFVQTVNVQLPNRLSAKSNSCVEVTSPAMEAQGRSQPVTMAIQHGLSSKGFKAGRADGIDGPKTRRAVAAFLEETGSAADLSDEQLFGLLYGYPLAKLARLGFESKSDCAKLALIAPPVVPKKAKKKSNPRPAKTATAQPKRNKVSKETVRRAVGIGISIGIGILNSRKKHGHHHRRPKRELY